ncbi:MAG: energy-coupling factor ABC transporter substrate-binding protein [Anaerolineae bacterium]|nr:energy-coupling factor ABC transporter substrate-binding protein [Anaerolineae bacterium]MDW8100925.1 energy-coupling factor ABC transporter substrate-binding protein [Anaerolineae bacterium]
MQPTPTSFPRGLTVLLVTTVIVLAVIPLFLHRSSEFGGADTAAQSAITEIAPDYEPWFSPVFEPPGSETESLLFAVQAALGAGFIGYFFGLKRGSRQAGR